MIKIKRKVIQIANSTQLISLPRKWCQKYNISKGEELDVQEENDRIIIRTESLPSINEISVDVSELTPRLVDRFIARAYQKGYDKINIKYDKEELAIAIQKKVPELIGFEIMEHAKNNLVIKSISQKIDIDFDSTLRRAFLIVLEMSNVCLEAYSKGDKNTLQNLYFKDMDLNRSCYFCLRHINQGLEKGFGINILYYLIETLEDIGDEFKHLSNLLAKIPSKKKKLINILSKINEFIKLIYEFFYNPEKSIAINSINLYNGLNEDIKSNSPTKDINECGANISLNYISRMLSHYITMRLDTLEKLTS